MKIEKNDFYTLSFFPEKYRDVLNYCGTHSGKDVDKIKEANLTPIFNEAAPFFEEANMVLICKKIYTDVIRGTPSVTQLMIIYFVIFATVNWEKWIIAAIAFSINSGAYVSEIIRAGILSIDKGQTEAGRSLGLSKSQTMASIIIPQAFKNIFPAMCNEFITLIKETAIVGYVGLVDIQKAGDFIKSATYEAFMPLIATAIIYFVLIKILTIGLGLIEKRLRKSDKR